MEAPNVFFPECLYGLNTSYSYNIKAHGPCGTLRLRKADYLSMVKSDEVFLFNILNFLSRNSQNMVNNFISLGRGTIAERLSFLILSLTHSGSKDIVMAFRRKDICTMLGVKRTSFFGALDAMKAEGYITYNQSEIHILDRNRLNSILKPKDAIEIGVLKAKNL